MKAALVWTQFWHPEVPLVRLAVFRIAACLLLLYDAFLYDPSTFGLRGAAAETTWRPIYLFELLGAQPPSEVVARICRHVQVVAILCGLVGWRTRSALAIATILGFWSSGVIYSLTKVRHDRVALLFASLALALGPSGARCSIDALRRRQHDLTTTSTWAFWPIRLTQVTVAIGYAAAGFAKLTTPDWLNGYTLQGIILGHQGPYAMWVAQSPTLCQGLSILTVIVECGFPAVLLWPGLAWFFVPAALAFHLGTWATMDTGPYMTLWFFLLAFVPLDRVMPWLRQRERSRWLRGATAFGALIVTALIGTVMLRNTPAWLLAGAIIAAAGVAAACNRAANTINGRVVGRRENAQRPTRT